MPVTVSEVRNPRSRAAFIDLPFRLHAGTQWVPPLRLERHLFLSPRTGPFFKHGDAQLFLARRDGRVVGRISAQVDHAYNDHHDTRRGWFGFLDFEDDLEILQALLEAAERWLTERGMQEMVGPADFAMNDESGVVVDGFDLPPMVRQPWHPPYYQRRCEQAGLQKSVDLQMWNLEVADRERMLPIMFELADAAREQHGVTLRRMERRHLRRELDLFAEIYNRAWRRNWGFVPYGPADLDAYAQELQLVYDRNWFMVAEKDGEPVGMAITVPDVNQALKRMNGRLLPLGWWHFLRRGSYIDRVRVGFLGVKPEFQHTGVAALLYVEHFETASRHPLQRGGEMGWILETNEAMNRGMEAMGGRVVKRYRMFERALSGGRPNG
jgi:GNAT superfamily N-acetyltransferase